MGKFKPMACGFHAHTDQGSLDSGSTVAAKILRADKLGRIADCVTDHGSMGALSDHWTVAAKLGTPEKDKPAKTSKKIKSIHGIELYVIDEQRPMKDFKNGKKEPRYYHLTVHFKDVQAYEYFCKMTPIMESRAIVRGGERKPLIYLRELEPISGHITLGSGCLMGPVQQNIMGHRDDPDLGISLEQRKEWAIQNYQKIREIAGPGNFFVEVFPHLICSDWSHPVYKGKTLIQPGFFKTILEKNHVCGPDCQGIPHVPDECGHMTIPIDIQKAANMFCVALGKTFHDPIVISEDSHVAAPEDKIVQDCVAKGTFIVTENGVKKIEEIIPGDLVLTHRGRFRKVLSTQGIFSKKRKIFIGLGAVNGIITTEDHRFYKPEVLKKEIKNNYGRRVIQRTVRDFIWESASNLTPEDYIWMPKIKERGSTQFENFIDLSSFIKINSKNLIDKTTEVISGISVDEDFCYFIGIFLGDGHSSGSDANVLINDWNIEGENRICRFLDNNHIPFVKKRNAHNGVTLIRINQSQFRRFLFTKFYKQKQKYINLDWFFSLSHEFQNILIKGLYHADGRTKGSSLSILTISPYIYGMLVHWALSNNLIFSNDYAPPKGQTRNLRILQLSETFGVHFIGQTKEEVLDKLGLSNKKIESICTKTGFLNQDGFSKKIKLVSNSDYEGPVYDLQVEEDESFVTVWGTVHNCRLGNGKERWKFFNNYCMRDSDEWAINLKQQLGVEDRDIEEWIDNSYQFVDLFKDYKMATTKDDGTGKPRILLPTIEMVYGESRDTREKLAELIKKHGRMPAEDDPRYPVYKKRLDYETDVLVNNGTADFLPYFFVIEDCANFARANGILMNTRGSGGGCLITYLLRISVTDPIKYNLPFERFLTLGRIKSGSLPDLDTDWEDRSLIIEYVLQKYGVMSALISTNMLLRVKSSVRDMERFRNGKVEQSTHVLLKMIKAAPQGVNDQDYLFGYTDKTTGAHVPGFLEEKSKVAEEFRQYIKTASWRDENGDDHLLWNDVLKCLAVTRTKGVHAGGIIITPKPVHDYMPLLVPKEEGILATAYTMKGVEDVGGVKYDFLGVKTLKSISIALKSIKARTGKEIEWEEFPHDPDVYKDIINSGYLAAIFQISTATMCPYVTKIKPKSIQDIANICALVRPGALEAPSPDPKDPESITAAMYFVMCANGIKQPYYIHESLKPILQDTYGVLLNQEQALQIFRDIGDYTFEEAENARRGIGKKDKDVLVKELTRLKARCLEKGWTEAQAQRLFETIVASARYSFNKAHSVSYAIVAYNGAWLKKHYPVDFWKGELEVRLDDQEKIREYLRECSKYILGVSVLNSHPTEWKIENLNERLCLRPPLASLKGCGQKSAENLRLFLDATSPARLFVHDVDPEKEEPEREEEPSEESDDME